MGNCANKPLTTEGDAPVEEVAETKATTTIEEREIEVDQNKVSSLAQMLENDGKKPEAEGATKTTDEKASEPPKIEQVTKEVAVETKKEEASKPADEPKKEEAKPAASEPRKEETKAVVAPAPAAAAATATAPAPAPAPAAATAEKK